MNESKNHMVIIRIHQLLLMVLLVFSLFVKEEVKKGFWLAIGLLVLSLLVQVFLHGAKMQKQES